MERRAFKKGDRVKLSSEAMRRNINGKIDPSGTRLGIASGDQRGYLVNVHWDGNKLPSGSYHVDFIELATTPDRRET